MIRKKLIVPSFIWALGLLTWGVSAIGAVPQAQAAFFMTPDAYYRLDDASAPFTDDFSADSAIVSFGTPTAGAGGLVNTAAAFDGASGLWVPDSTGDKSFDWAADASFAIEIWMKRDAATPLNSANGVEVLIGRDDSDAANPSATKLHWWLGLMDLGSGPQVVGRLGDSDGDGVSVFINGSNSSPTAVVDGQWHQIMLVRDAGNLRNLLYIDGKLEDTSNNVDYTTNPLGFEATQSTMDIGWLGISTGVGPTDYTYNGTLDQVALYGTALTAVQVDQIYQIGNSNHALDDEFGPIYPSGTTDLGISAQGYAVTVNAVPAANPAPTSYALDANAPAGMTVDASGQVSWMPTNLQSGVFSFSVTATNTVDSGTGNYTIEIVAPCEDLDAYWHLEEDGTSGYASAVGANLTGACATGGCPAQDTTDGQVNNAQIFNGGVGINVPASAYADLAFDWAAADSFTIEFWMKRAAGGLASQYDTEVLMGRSDAPVWWFIGVRNVDGSHIRTYVNLVDSDGNGSGVEITNAASGKDVTDGLWHHVALVRDAMANETRVYVDGVLDASDDTVTYTGTFASDTAALNIGHLTDSFGFTGSLDEVAMYASALDAEVLLQHATQNPGRGFCNSAPVITSGAVTTADPTLAYSYDADATDADGDSVTWSLPTHPAGMTINSQGIVSWAQSDVASEAGNNVDVEIQVTDAYGGVDTQTFTISVSAIPATAPTITGQVALTATSGTALEIKVTDLRISDSDSTVFTLTVMDGANYTRSGNTITPDASFTGDLAVPVKVNDGTTDSNTFSLKVTVTAPGASTGGGGGGGGGGCFIESSRTTGSIGGLKAFGILMFSMLGLVSATALSGRKN